jgi:hypothetical protein
VILFVAVLLRNLKLIKDISKEKRMSSLIFDFAELSACFSSCVKLINSFSMEYTERPPLKMLISTSAIWQKTALKTMVKFCPECSVEEVVLGAEEPSTIICQHKNTFTDDDHFFASSGNGSIKTTLFCTDCRAKLSESWEYFD